MDSLAKENQLLKGYIATLEKENEAKNVERQILTDQIERMSQEISKLQGLSTKSASQTSSKQITQLKQVNIELSSQLATVKQMNSQMALGLQITENQVAKMNEERQRLTADIQELSEARTIASHRISTLEGQIANLWTRNAQLDQLYISKTELESANKSLQSITLSATAELQKTKNQHVLLQNQNEQLRLMQKSINQGSSIKANYEATIKRLNSKIDWHQSNLKTLAQEKVRFEQKISELELELNKANTKIIEFRSKEETSNFESSRLSRLKEMEGMQQMITNLKDNKQYLERSLKQKAEKIAVLESKLQQTVHYQANQQNQINTLLQSKADSNKQISILIKANQELSYQIDLQRQKEEGYLTELASFRREREALLREIDQYRTSLEEARGELKTYRARAEDSTYNIKEVVSPRHRLESDVKGDDNQDLRLMVMGLQQQIEGLKASQLSRPPSMLEQSQVESYLNLNSKSQLMMHSRSPPSRVTPTNDRQRVAHNKNKWESLQWKINLLRNENQNLKRTLFE